MKFKVEVENPYGIVTNATTWHTELAASLVITTKERGVFPCGEESQCRGNYIRFLFYTEDESGKGDFVKLIGLDDESKELVTSFNFLLSSKDELWYLFPKKSVWEELKGDINGRDRV